MVTFLGLLVQPCFGEGGTLQTYITGVCGECSQSLRHTEFVPTHGVCAFPVSTVQILGWSARNCFRWALGCMHFPGLSHSGSGSQVLHRGTDFIGPTFCALPRSKQLRWPGTWRVQSPPIGGCVLSPPPSSQLGFLGVQLACLLRCSVYLFWGADLWLQPSRGMSTVQNPKKFWLAINPACSLVDDSSLGPQLPPFWL